MSAPRVPPPEALQLPVLDEGDDDEVDVGAFDLNLSLNDDDDEVPEREALHQDSFEVDIQTLTDPGSSEAASDLDVGVEDLLGALPETAVERDDDELPPVTADDLDTHLATPLDSDDPSSDAELGDDGLEGLPELARDEGDEGPDTEGALLAAAPEGELAEGPSYGAEWLVLGTPCSALWSSAGTVLCAADHLMRFGRERRSHELPHGVRVSSLALLGSGGVLMATTRGLLEQAPEGTWSSWPAPDPVRAGNADVVEVAAAPFDGALWARLSSGLLSRRRSDEWERHETGGVVRALTRHGERLTLLVLAQRPTLQLSSDGGRSFRELLLPEPAASIALGTTATAVSGGQLVVVCDSERGLAISNDGGSTFRWVTGAVNVTAVAIGEHGGAPAVFAALHREARDVSQLILVEPASGRAVTIAELSGQTEEDAEEAGRTQALVYEDGYLWAAGGYGLARLKAP